MPKPVTKKRNSMRPQPPLTLLCADGSRIVPVSEHGEPVSDWTAPQYGYVVHPDDRNVRGKRGKNGRRK